ncbi:hypothetical protein EYF80_054371 [Liparis tanakae]|uniref:Uncharacterized protein n=1 Tax=Liparis tanakae TaxID=230148 RepID=A0A4Z2F3W6_9TELE|nr:hypothetical protein EYF80_054371 [Liparis tanakae]
MLMEREAGEKQSATMWPAGTASGVCRDGDMSIKRQNVEKLSSHTGMELHLHTCTATKDDTGSIGMFGGPWQLLSPAGKSAITLMDG